MVETRVLIVAGDALARAGLAALLSAQPGCTVAGQVDAGADLADALQVYRPDVVLWDLGWDPAAALERLADLRESGVPVAVLLPDERSAPDAWSSGAHGLLLREAEIERLAAALTAVAQGLIAVDPALAGALVAPRGQTGSLLAEELTPRELQVLRLMAEGLPSKVIALRLSISEHTVKFHINSILGKLGAQSRTDAVVRATRLGLVLL